MNGSAPIFPIDLDLFFASIVFALAGAGAVILLVIALAFLIFHD